MYALHFTYPGPSFLQDPPGAVGSFSAPGDQVNRPSLSRTDRRMFKQHRHTPYRPHIPFAFFISFFLSSLLFFFSLPMLDLGDLQFNEELTVITLCFCSCVIIL